MGSGAGMLVITVGVSVGKAGEGVGEAVGVGVGVGGASVVPEALIEAYPTPWALTPSDINRIQGVGIK